MRKLTHEELTVLADIYKLPVQQRELDSFQKQAIIPMGEKLSIIHQVLFS